LVSHSPVATAVITRLAMEILVQLNNLRLPAEEREPIGITTYLKGFAIDLTLVGFGVLVGSLFRLWR
jgi:hypothetical protein